MEKYSKAISEMYSQFKKVEKVKAHPMEKYIGRRTVCEGVDCEVVGYTKYRDGSYRLIVDATLFDGWRDLDADDVIFKDCESYWYVSIDDLMD